jgi:hypothetical protein
LRAISATTGCSGENEQVDNERVCGECGSTYDPATRGVAGPFHFLVVSVIPGPGTPVSVVGHWRSGAWLSGESLSLNKPDGATTVLTAAMDPIAETTAARRGQRRLTLTFESTPDVVRGCIKPSAPQR